MVSSFGFRVCKRNSKHETRNMITSISNPKIKLVRELQTKRKEREAQKLFVIEGVRLAEEAARAKAKAALVLHTADIDARAKQAVDALAQLGAQVETVSPSVMATASETKTPQGLLAVVPFLSSFILHPLSFALVLDRLSDPGNLGAILRTADAAGVEAVFLAPDTVDAYNPKVVRAAMGAHFHLPIVEITWDELATRLAGLETWLAEAREGEAYDRVDWREPCALVIGSEAEGPSEAALKFAQKRVHIPMPGQAESLNAAVAAGVLLFEAARQKVNSKQ
jgi:TrmH family RNA methyltransferase